MSVIDSVTAAILIVTFIATIFRSTFGFGEALIAVPLLAIWLPLNVAVPLSVLVSVTIAAVIVVHDRNRIHIRSAGGLILFTLIGIPIGLFLLLRANEDVVKAILGIVLIAFSLYLLLGKQLKELKKDSIAWLFSCGFLAGILGGAYGINGPPLVIYGAMRRWSAQHFRATLQGYFLVAGIIGLIGYWITGMINSSLIHYYILTLPVVIPGIFIGRWLNHRLSGEGFYKYVYFILGCIGTFLVIKSLTK